ncbi:MAG TPA: hypothetical protein VL199_09720, partial [Burkholderiales bacterium]|nr:hypothetical protein [Burkholderiales bacterium]
RACVRGVEDADKPIEVKVENDPVYGPLAKEDVVNLFDALTPAIVQEIGAVCYFRANSPPPKH